MHLPAPDRLGVHLLSRWPFWRSLTASPMQSAETGWTLRISRLPTGRFDHCSRNPSHSEAIHGPALSPVNWIGPENSSKPKVAGSVAVQFAHSHNLVYQQMAWKLLEGSDSILDCSGPGRRGARSMPTLKQCSKLNSLPGRYCPTMVQMKIKQMSKSDLLSVRCPKCSAAIGQPCELLSGGQRNEPHPDRKLIAAEIVEMKRIHKGRTDHSNRWARKSQPGRASRGSLQGSD